MEFSVRFCSRLGIESGGGERAEVLFLVSGFAGEGEGVWAGGFVVEVWWIGGCWGGKGWVDLDRGDGEADWWRDGAGFPVLDRGALVGVVGLGRFEEEWLDEERED